MLWTRFFTFRSECECRHHSKMPAKTEGGNETSLMITSKDILIMLQCPFCSLSEGHSVQPNSVMYNYKKYVVYEHNLHLNKWKCVQDYTTLMHLKKHSWLTLLEMIKHHLSTLPQRFWSVSSFFTLIRFPSLPLSFPSRLNLLRQKGLTCAWYARQNCYTRIQPVRRTPER